MRRVHKDIKPEERPKPQGIKTQPAFVVRSHVGVGSVEPSPANDLFPSWYKTKTRTSGKEIIDKVSNKLATDCTPELARQEAGNANANQFSADKFHGGGGTASTTEKDDVHKCEDAKPSITLTVSGAGNSFLFTATASQGTHPLNSDRFKGTVNFKVDGQVVSSQQVSDSPSTVSYNHNFSSAGAHNVTAEVIDSVLYSNSDTQSIESSGGAVASTFSLTGVKQNLAVTKFEWAGANGTVTVYRASDNQVLCSSAGSSCNNNTAIASGTAVYAKDSGGAQANATVSGP